MKKEVTAKVFRLGALAYERSFEKYGKDREEAIVNFKESLEYQKRIGNAGKEDVPAEKDFELCSDIFKAAFDKAKEAAERFNKQ